MGKAKLMKYSLMPTTCNTKTLQNEVIVTQQTAYCINGMA